MLDYTSIFVTEYSPQLRLEYSVKSYKITDRIISLLPASFMLPILIYASLSPTLGTILDPRTATFGKLPDIGQLHLQPSIIDRVHVLEQYSRFTDVHRCHWALLFGLWHPPDMGAGSPRQFWQKVETRIERGDDVLLLLMRKQAQQSHPRFAGLFTQEVLRVILLFRDLRDKVAPPGSLPRRAVSRLVGTLTAPLRIHRKEA